MSKPPGWPYSETFQYPMDLACSDYAYGFRSDFYPFARTSLIQKKCWLYQVFKFYTVLSLSSLHSGEPMLVWRLQGQWRRESSYSAKCNSYTAKIRQWENRNNFVVFKTLSISTFPLCAVRKQSWLKFAFQHFTDLSLRESRMWERTRSPEWPKTRQCNCMAADDVRSCSSL